MIKQFADFASFTPLLCQHCTCNYYWVKVQSYGVLFTKKIYLRGRRTLRVPQGSPFPCLREQTSPSAEGMGSGLWIQQILQTRDRSKALWLQGPVGAQHHKWLWGHTGRASSGIVTNSSQGIWKLRVEANTDKLAIPCRIIWKTSREVCSGRSCGFPARSLPCFHFTEVAHTAFRGTLLVILSVILLFGVYVREKSTGLICYFTHLEKQWRIIL